MSVPPATISAQRKSYSSCEPSTQWMAAGSVSSAIFATHLFKCSFLLRGSDALRVLCSEIVFGICDVALDQRSDNQASPDITDTGFQLPRLCGCDRLIDSLNVLNAFGGEEILQRLQAFC